jgi:SAM-dependent methyltransferase
VAHALKTFGTRVVRRLRAQTRTRDLLKRWGKEPVARSEWSRFRCNICGTDVSAPVAAIRDREMASCSACGSNLRFRTIIAGLSRGIFGKPIAIPDFPKRLDISGIGLSDANIYAERLPAKLAYRNTFLHTEPFLDIADVGAAPYKDLDFLISSDVFEHVAPPIDRAFRNARRLLKPGGAFVFSVPFGLGKTTEHFPNLHKYVIESRKSGRVLVNETAGGAVERFEELVFHDGDGTTLEMRVFGLEDLRILLAENGFVAPLLLNDALPEFGIDWQGEVFSIPMLSYAK